MKYAGFTPGSSAETPAGAPDVSALNFQGKIFVGNTGSFAIGMTIAAFAVVTDLKASLLISILPYIFNSSLILLTIFFTKKRAQASFDGEKIVSNHRRSLVTLVTYHRPLTELQAVAAISVIVAVFVSIAVLIELPWSFLI